MLWRPEKSAAKGNAILKRFVSFLILSEIQIKLKIKLKSSKNVCSAAILFDGLAGKFCPELATRL